MNSARQGALRQVRQVRIRQLQRRYESHESHSHGQASASSPPNESISWKFWLGLGVFPAFYFVYNTAGSTADGKNSPFGSLIERFSTAREEWERRNTLHTASIEQAAQDRNLFQGAEGSKMIDLSFPEVFNVGSPINVPAGHYSNIDKVIEHYKKQNALQAEKTRKRLEEGRQLD